MQTERAGNPSAGEADPQLRELSLAIGGLKGGADLVGSAAATVNEHIPKAHQRYANTKPANLIRQAAGIGANTAILVERMMRATSDGSLPLHCSGLVPFTRCRSPEYACVVQFYSRVCRVRDTVLFGGRAAALSEAVE